MRACARRVGPLRTRNETQPWKQSWRGLWGTPGAALGAGLARLAPMFISRPPWWRLAELCRPAASTAGQWLQTSMVRHLQQAKAATNQAGKSGGSPWWCAVVAFGRRKTGPHRMRLRMPIKLHSTPFPTPLMRPVDTVASPAPLATETRPALSLSRSLSALTFAATVQYLSAGAG